MRTTTLTGLVNNAALLLALGLLYDTIALRQHSGKTSVQVRTGIVLGAIGIAVMMTPWEFAPGIIFDTRSILLSVGGLFFGSVPTLVAVLMTSIYRLLLGGAAAWVGVGVIVTSGAIGVAWRYLRRDGLETVSSLELYILGIFVHVVMLLWMLLLPWSVAVEVLSKISLPLMTVHPVSTLLLGSVMTSRLKRRRAEEALRESNQRLEETLAELRETQEQMMHQERLAAVGQLSAGIAHDFNNILASIVLYTQMSLGTSELSPTIRKRLEVIAREADHGADLVQQMLDFGRQAVLRREDLDLEPLLGKAVALLERTLPENVRIDLASEPGETIIYADPARVQQAIVNLASNARDAMPGGGELHIALARVEGGEIDCVDCGRVVGGVWVQVTVRDTGTGIPAEALPHIFEPFFTTRAPLGHGLGLAQVYGIVKQHEGHIEVETEVGRGTTFRLYWPALPVAGPEAQVRIQADAAPGEGQTILVVEDNAAMRTALVDVMDMLGYRVLEAANGREALAVCEEHIDNISLVLSDWVMPLMGGLALVRELEERDMAVKVLMLTGHPLDYETSWALPKSVVGWVLKPPSLEQLTEAVAQALARSESAPSA
jgi:signal transduction histidine kinase/ActR/RegA family two-component response regulator